MGVDDNGNFIFEQRGGDFLNRSSRVYVALQSEKVVGTVISSMAMHKEVYSSMPTPCSFTNVPEQFLVTDWKVAQNGDFNGSTGLSSHNIGVNGSQGVHSSITGMVEGIPKLSCFGSGSLSEIVSSFGLPESSQIPSALCPQDFPLIDDHLMEKDAKGKKRKRAFERDVALLPHSPLDVVQDSDSEQQKDVSPETVKCPIEKDEKKQKSELNPGINTCKPTAKHVKEHSQDDDTPSEDYIHVRAKRGQATNSHSLAERVRREKISERMRLLQDLVPGCNKITGKAMMLDEIINYVQSLQRQVEFLSMKLAAVNPDMDFDIEQILSADILHSRGVSSAMLGFDPVMSTHHPHFHGSSSQEGMQAEMVMCSIPTSCDMLRTTIHDTSPMVQIPSIWDYKLQNVARMGFIPNQPHNGMELNGSMKVDL